MLLQEQIIFFQGSRILDIIIFSLFDVLIMCFAFLQIDWWSEGHGLAILSLHFHHGTRNRGEIKILIFSTKMLSIRSTVPTEEPNKTTKTDTGPLMTKLHRIGHSCDCIYHLYCIVSNTTHCHSKGKRV